MSRLRIQHVTFTRMFLFVWISSAMSANSNYANKIIAYDNINDGRGSYSFRFETSDGTQRSEGGQLEIDPVLGQVYRVKGSYSFVGPDGVVYTVEYTADENGFHPIKSHLPGPARPEVFLSVPEGASAALPPDVVSSL